MRLSVSRVGRAPISCSTPTGGPLTFRPYFFVLGLRNDGRIRDPNEGGTTSYQKRSNRKPRCKGGTCSRGEDANVQSVRTLEI